MRKVIYALLAVSALAAVSTTTADASGGCGPYRHRGPYGYCRPNFGGVYFGGPVIGYGYGYGWHRPYYGYGWHARYWHGPYGHRHW